MAKKQKVAILGGGNGAHAMACDLISRDFEVNLFEFEELSSSLSQLFETKTITCKGEINGQFKLNTVTSDITEAINGVRYICITTPAFTHRRYAELLKGVVNKNDQIIALYPGAFAGLLFKTILADECPVIAEVNNLPYDTRLESPCQVTIYGYNDVNIAFMPAANKEDLFNEMQDLQKFERMYTDVLEAGLSIVNPAFHAGLCLFSVNEIENWPKRPFFLYEHGVTPSSVKMNIVLDNERKAVGKVFGYDLRPIEDFSGMDEGYSWKELYMNIHGNISLTSISGPHNIQSRYFTEDAPFGLVPWSFIGKTANIPTPYIDSVVNIYNVIHESDWWNIGRNMDDLGIDGLSIEEIKSYLQTGNK